MLKAHDEGPLALEISCKKVTKIGSAVYGICYSATSVFIKRISSSGW
ncbi:hypothetical protein KN1_00830 [Stygiolobus caldivivus]|uniref:Uncharacterized protein n=1 Tax=Stygiolobus caldivivus TaxID=2824673 RepID=A0A8D5U3N9_9CREN|nr:hypothetical protein KN1_00830 [Stygiolobus caldivivus]